MRRADIYERETIKNTHFCIESTDRVFSHFPQYPSFFQNLQGKKKQMYTVEFFFIKKCAEAVFLFFSST